MLVRRFTSWIGAASVLAFSVPCLAQDLSENLLVNSDAEAHRCTRDWTAQSPVPGWRVVRGAASVLCYDAFASTGVTPILPADPAPGNALFAGPGIDSAIEQTVDVRAAVSAIDASAVSYDLSGWLGGWSGREQSAIVTAVFLNDRGEATGAPAVLGDPDLQAHAAQTGLAALRVGGPVPVGTRAITVTIDFPSGAVSFQNALADNVQLKLGGVRARLSPAPLRAPAADSVPPLDHVYIVMMENTNYADVVHGDAPTLSIDEHMPFLASMAKSGVLLSDMWATYHPSDENYVAMVGGDTYKFGPVYYPDYDLPVTHLGDLLDAERRPWRAYVQHMNTPCNLVIDSNGGWFSPDDEPFAHFADVIGDAGRCTAALRDLNDLEAAVQAGAPLPDFAWIAADGWWDGEGAWMESFDVGFSLAKQDAFLESALAPLLQSAQWRRSRSMLVLTWDESDGWGWPDNHVPTVVVGSPGLLREGQVVDAHYDGYGVLRTAERALGVGSLGRFDEYARPLVEIFSGSSSSSSGVPAQLTLRPSEAAATRGRLEDTFGRVAVPTGAVQGETLTLLAPPGVRGTIIVAPLGAAPVQTVAPLGGAPTRLTRIAIDSSGRVDVPTAQLASGLYGAWLQIGNAPPAHAPLPFAVLPQSRIAPDAPGVEIEGAAGLGAGNQSVIVREGANIVVHYCRPRGATASDVWIGLFPVGTPADQLTRDNANAIGYWLKTPGSSPTSPCGDASAFTSELAPSADYEVLLMRDRSDGTSHSVGHVGRFTLLPTLP
jgi:hypothetical protein